MKKGKRLLITLLATLTMVASAFGVAYAVNVYDNHSSTSHGAATITATDGQLIVECDYHSHVSTTPPYDYYCEFHGGQTVTIKPAENLVYNGQQKPVTVEGLGGGITKDRLYYTGTQADGTDYAESSAAPTNAGTYTASLKVKVRDESEQIITKTFTIQPKEVAIYWQRSSAGGNDFTYGYDGQSHAPIAKVDANSLVGSDTCNVEVTGEETNAGNWTATAESLDNPNYKLPANNTQGFEITKKSVSFEWDRTGEINPQDPPKEDGPSYYYTGKPQAPAIGQVSGVVEGDDCTVVLKEESKKTDVGTWWAESELSGEDSGNYTFADLQVINQKFYIVKKLVQPVWSEKKLIYNAKLQHPEVTLAYTDGSDITEEDAKKVEAKVYLDEDCTQEVTGKTVVGTKYYAKASLTDDTDFDFDPDWDLVEPFIIYAKPVTVTLTSENPITYDAQWHKPEVEIEGVEDGDDCVPVESLKGKTKITMVDPDTGAKTNSIDIDDVNVDDEKGVYHASVDKYTAKVENKNTVDPEDEGYVVEDSGLKGEDARNYIIEKDVTCKFAILPLEITLDWFRPAYNEYGDETGGEPVLVDVDNGEKLNLVFNGKKQVPVAKIKESLLLTNPETQEPDVCKITVKAPKEAVEARPDPYTAEDISFSNPDYTRDKNGVDYYIIPRPVKLEWDAKEKTYNGKEQKRTVEITNIQKNDRGQNYSAEDGIGVVEVSKITYTPGFHFGTEGKDTDEAETTLDGETGYPTETGEPELGMAEGTAIAENRTPTDAGTYVMTAAELSDPFNYTLVKIDPESVELDPAVIPEAEEPAYVDDHHPIYTIHQYEIKKIDWRNTTVTYNASNQKPIAEVNKSNLQGPDTNKEVAVMIHADKNSAKDDFVGKCNAKTYDIYVLKNEDLRGIKGARCMNYFIGKSAKEMQTKFVINKKLLTVTVLNKTGYYGDNPSTYKHTVKYAGLINGKVNTDDNHQNKNIPGKYNPNAPEEGSLKDVVEGTLKYTTNYKKWGKPGTYTIKASGLKSDNYKIKYVAGKLTIKNRLLAGDLLAKAKAGDKKGTITWNKVYGASKYQLYFSLCNQGDDHSYKAKLYKTVGAKTNKIEVKNLQSRTYYKFYVVALDKDGKIIAKTPLHHFCTNDRCGDYTNPKSVKASKTKVSLAKGKTYKLSASVTKVIPWKNLTSGLHTQKLRYKTGNKNIATVSANGTIKAVGTGWCRVYVMGANGIWQTVEVTVK